MIWLDWLLIALFWLAAAILGWLAHTYLERFRLVLAVTGHWYFSTACLHSQHGQCGKLQHDRGEPRHPRCKYCPAPCRCTCHQREADG